VRAKVLYPPSELKIASADDAPLILQLILGEDIPVLFESDAGSEAEEALLNSKEDLRSDILIKGQHHNGGSATPEFLEAVNPRLIIATSRDSPMMEKISDEWASSTARRGIKLFRQDQTGAVEIEFRGDQWRARSYLTGEVFRSTSR
jgi:competence protein ComEC